MKTALIFFFVLAFNFTQTTASEERARKVLIPKIHGDTLVIEGKIDSHIYDFFSFEYRKVKSLKKVSLNSFGGSTSWGLLIGEKIQELGLGTHIEEGNFCASACLFLFGSGAKRTAHESVWLGVHGARISGSMIIEFQNNCFDIIDSTTFMLNEKKPACPDFLDRWYELSFNATEEGFDLIENAGVSSKLRTDYYAMDDDPEWFKFSNIFKKPDLVLDYEGMKKYHLVTD